MPSPADGSTIALYLFILTAALATAGFVLMRRWQSRRALVARLAELSVLADVGRTILDAPLDLTQLAERVYRQAGQVVETSFFQLGLFEEDRYRLLLWVADGERQMPTVFRLTPESRGIIGWVRDARRSLLVRDFEADIDALPAQPRYNAPNPPRSAVFVPLQSGEKVLGVIGVQSRQPNAFTEEHQRLLIILATHAAAALDKTRLFEQAQRRATQLELLTEVTQQINVLQPLPSLYRQIVSLVAEKFSEYSVSFYEFNNDTLTLRATTQPELALQPLVIKTADDIVGKAAATRATVVARQLPDYPRTGAEDGGGAIQCQLAVPVEIENRVLGVLDIHNHHAATFDDATTALFQSLAAQVAFAIFEAELYETERRRAEQMAAMAQATRAVASTLELDDLLDEVLDLLEERFGFKRVHVFLLEEDSLVFRAGIGRGSARWGIEGLSYPLGGPGLIALVGRTQQDAVVRDVSAHPDYVPGPGLEDTRSEIAAPIIMASKLLGVLDVQSDSPNAFSEDDVQTLHTLADTLAVAIRNARLFEIERRRRRLADTLREVSVALTSTLQLDAVLDLILDGLAKVVNYNAASILLANEVGELILRASRGVPDAEEMVGAPFNVKLFTIAEGYPQTVAFSDVDHLHQYHDLLALPEPHACLGALLMVQGEHLGYLVVDRAGLSHFPQGEVELIAAFASQAAVAIENARLFTAQREQAWVSTALLQVAEATTRATQLSEVLDTVARLTMMLVGVDCCAVVLADEERYSVAAYDGRQKPPEAAALLPSFQLSQWRSFADMVERGEPVVIAATDPDEVMPAEYRELFADVVLILPLMAKGKVEGGLVVGQVLGEAPFNSNRIQLLGGIANQTALAIESAMLYEAQQEEAWVSAALLQVAEAVARQPTLEDGLAAVARLTPLLVGVERVAIYNWDAVQQVYRASQLVGIGVDGAAALIQTPVPPATVQTDRSGDPPYDLQLPEPFASHFGAVRCWVWPLQARGDRLGAFVVDYCPPTSLGRRLNILNGIAHQLTMAIENSRLAHEVAMQQRLEHELAMGREIQATFLPKQYPHVAGWDISAYWSSARQVGGDFYDFIPLPTANGETKWGLAVADVADKGVPAALFMALSRTLLRTVAIGRVTPAATLSRVNDLILADARSELFVTVLYAVWEPETGRIQYANGGHNPPLVVHADGQVEKLAGRGAALGVFEGVDYTEHELTLEKGESLVLYTDGLPDAINTREEEFGTQRLIDVLSEWQASPAEEIVARIAAAVQEHVGAAEVYDDTTIVVLKRSP